jgi:hypothetical protein
MEVYPITGARRQNWFVASGEIAVCRVGLVLFLFAVVELLTFEKT